MRQQTADAIISSRLLILQTKRLMLRSAERRHGETGLQSMLRRVERLKTDTASAQHAYRTAMLSWGSTQQHAYWLVAYSRLVEMGNTLTRRLSDAVVELPPPEGYEAAADVEMLENIVGRWKDSLRASMSAAGV